MLSVERTALRDPELIGFLPKPEANQSCANKICNAFKAIKNSPYELTVLGALGVVSGLAMVSTLTARFVLPEDNTRNEILDKVSGFFGITSAMSSLAYVVLMALPNLRAKVAVFYMPEGHSLDFRKGNETYKLELYDPAVDLKLPRELIDICSHAMKHGAQIGEVLNLANRVCDKVDELNEHNIIGVQTMKKVQDWFYQNYKRQFSIYRKVYGVDYEIPDSLDDKKVHVEAESVV